MKRCSLTRPLKTCRLLLKPSDCVLLGHRCHLCNVLYTGVAQPRRRMWPWGPSKILRVKGMARQGSSDGLNETTTAAESPSAPACRVHNHSSTSSHQDSTRTRQLAFAAELRRVWLVGMPQDGADVLLAAAGSMEGIRDGEDEEEDRRRARGNKGRNGGTWFELAIMFSHFRVFAHPGGGGLPRIVRPPCIQIAATTRNYLCSSCPPASPVPSLLIPDSPISSSRANSSGAPCSVQHSLPLPSPPLTPSTWTHNPLNPARNRLPTVARVLLYLGYPLSSRLRVVVICTRATDGHPQLALRSR